MRIYFNSIVDVEWKLIGMDQLKSPDFNMDASIPIGGDNPDPHPINDFPFSRSVEFDFPDVGDIVGRNLFLASH